MKMIIEPLLVQIPIYIKTSGREVVIGHLAINEDEVEVIYDLEDRTPQPDPFPAEFDL